MDIDGDGYVSVLDGGDDCDDLDVRVHPGADEICDDGVDNDCSGDDNGCALAGTMLLSNAELRIAGSDDGDAAGWSAGAAGDVDGDGWDDLLVGAPGQDASGAGAGAAYLVRGRASGVTSLAVADARMVGGAQGDAGGHCVMALGDLNGDGYDDVGVGAWGHDELDDGVDAGAAYLLMGPFSGALRLEQAADARVVGDGRFDVAGWVISAGSTDILVGAPYDDTPGDGAGGVYLFHAPFFGVRTLEQADASLLGVAALDYAGVSADLSGDGDGDGIDDALVGAYWEATAGAYAGAAYVVSGPVSGSSSLADSTAFLVAQDEDDLAGWSVAWAGDTNGDGYDDVLVGAYGRGAKIDDVVQAQVGAAYLMLGPVVGRRGLGGADAIIDGEERTARVGFSVAGAGHLDGDDLADVVIGAPGATGEAEHSGAAFVFYGPVSGSVSTSEASVLLMGAESGEQAGWSVGRAGDMLGTGYGGVWVGAPSSSGGGQERGTTYVVPGHGL